MVARSMDAVKRRYTKKRDNLKGVKCQKWLFLVVALQFLIIIGLFFYLARMDKTQLAEKDI